MTRAINFDLPEDQVATACQESGVTISAIEPLQSGGTHLVCTTSEGADEMRLRYANHIIEGPVRRHPFYRKQGPN